MKKITYFSMCLLLIALLSVDTGLRAQQTGTYGFGAHYSRPTGQLQNKGYRDGGGVNMNMLSRSFGNSPILGLQYGAQFDFEFSSMQGDPLIMPSPDTGELSEMSVENTQIGLHGIARMITTDRLPVQLYADGLIGSRLMLGQESFVHVDETYDCPEVNTLQKDLVLSYGGALGALVRLGRFGSLDLRATYLTSSGPAEFIDLTSVSQTEAGSYGYRVERAPASQLRFQVGIRLPLNGMCSGW